MFEWDVQVVLAELSGPLFGFIAFEFIEVAVELLNLDHNASKLLVEFKRWVLKSLQ